MSLRDYEISRRIESETDWGEDFYALIMLAMRHADTDNGEKLKAAWPQVWAELSERYNAPAGLLVGESVQRNTGVDPASFETIERREDGLYIDGQLARAI